MVEIQFIGKCLLVSVSGKRILAVGDLHLGYEEALNISGVGVGRKLFGEMIGDLGEIFTKTGRVDEVVLLGDVKHVFGTVLQQEREDFRRLLEYFEKRCEKIVIVQGNHDAIVGFLIRENTEVRDFYCVGDVCFVHGDKDFKELHTKEVKNWVIGHAHPAVTISDGIKQERYKCFLEGVWNGKKIVIVPSFSQHSEGNDIITGDLGIAWNINFKKFKVFIVGENLKILDFGKIEDLYSS